MAITPQIAAGLSDEQQILLARVVSEIDVFLSENYISGRTIDVRTALLLDAINSSPRVVDAIIATYVAAGWSVARYKNFKQGEWLSFSDTP